MSDPRSHVLRILRGTEKERVSPMQLVTTMKSESLTAERPPNQESVYWLRDVASEKDKATFEK